MSKLCFMIAVTFMSALWCQPTHAARLTSFDAMNAAFLSSIETVNIIIVTDDVSGGCLPAPRRLKDKMEIVLRKNGFSVVDEDVSSQALVHIETLGLKSGGSCAVHIMSNVLFIVQGAIPSSKYVRPKTTSMMDKEINIGSMILTGGNMQKRLVEIVEEHADTLSLEIFRAREFKFEYR